MDRLDGDGNFDVLEVETRNFKGPRVYDASGLPLHRDNQSIFKERIYLDKADPNLLHDEITVIDNALTRPWTVDKKYVRNADRLADWPESICIEYNAQVFIGNDNYFLSADGYLMPAKKGQKPPDTRYFDRAEKWRRKCESWRRAGEAATGSLTVISEHSALRHRCWPSRAINCSRPCRRSGANSSSRTSS